MPTTKPLTRRQRRGIAAHIAHRKYGVPYADLAARFDVGQKVVSDYVNDPMGHRRAELRARRSGRCGSCGGPTSEAKNGHVPTTCRDCLQNGSPVVGTRRPFSWTCGVPDCDGRKLADRHVCAEHAPLFDRLRQEVAVEEATRANRHHYSIHGTGNPDEIKRRRRKARREAERDVGQLAA